MLLREDRYRISIAINLMILTAQMVVLVSLSRSLGMLSGSLAWLVSGSLQALTAMMILRAQNKAGSP